MIEIIAVTSFVFATAFLALSSDGIFSALPITAALAMATVRILPAAQMVYGSYTLMQSSHIAVTRCLSILFRLSVEEYSAQEEKLVPFERTVALEDVWFRFNATTMMKAPHHGF